MRYQVIIPPILLIPICMTSLGNHTSKVQNDVIVTYSKHAEAEPNDQKANVRIIVPENLLKIEKDISKMDRDSPKTKEDSKTGKDNSKMRRDNSEKQRDFFVADKDKFVDNGRKESNEVVFVPNTRDREINNDYLYNNPIPLEEYVNRRTVGDVMSNGPVRVETESPSNQDIVFITGKNNENENTATERKKEMHAETRRSGTEIVNVPKLNCTNLDCNNTIESVCGGKIEHKQWKYRLFLNECFFRKVNCYFKHAVNRYLQVSLDKCKNTGSHGMRPTPVKLHPPVVQLVSSIREKIPVNNTRKSLSSRRSQSVAVDGRFCSHFCPASCGEEYAPECAVSGNGRRVFLNHCQLDFNSCRYGVVWHRRPLSECVGGKKADLQQNRGFIDWMQRVGIVDSKGRLVLA